MKVCIAEKPSVAKDLASILGAKNRKEGYFEGNGYCVTWTFGHLCTLKEPEDYLPELKRWQISNLPIIPPQFGIKLINNSGVEKQFKTIAHLIKHAEEVINCGDAGQEGEVIQRWVLQKAKCNKPIKRLWISSLTEDAIREGFANLKDGNDYNKLYAAGSSRAIGDWLLGINATRLYTLKFGQNKQVLSVGRVQTPTLALIVNRFLEIEKFVPKPFWEIKTKYRQVEFNSVKGKYLDKEKALEIAESIKGHPFKVDSFKKKKGKEYAPRLFDLTSLQVECNKKFAFSADETLKYVQNLYEKKHVTYPRVDTTYLPSDLFPKIKGILQSLVGYKKYTDPILTKTIKKNKRVFDDKKITDHHAIIPTDQWPGGSQLTLNEKKVYDIIAKRFIANFMDDCDVSKTEVLGSVEKTKFKTTGKQIISSGWREIYSSDPKNSEDVEDDKEDDKEQTLPEFEAGESGPHTPDLKEKTTSPPKLYTEATLLRAMEAAGKQITDENLREALKENGIGRPSTRANIIETLFRRKYIVKNRKNLLPTTTGIELIGTIKNDLLKSAELTGQWENKMRLIEKGEYDPKVFMEELKDMVKDVVTSTKLGQQKSITILDDDQLKEEAKAKKKIEIEKLTCPKCQKANLIKGKNAFGCSGYKSGCNFILPFEFGEKKLSPNNIQDLILKKKTSILKNIRINGENKEGRVILSSEFKIDFEQKM